MTERVTIDQKIARANENPYIREFDGENYQLYDETRKKEQADSWRSSLERRGYKTYTHERLIDDIMKGKWWYVYDVYFKESG